MGTSSSDTSGAKVSESGSATTASTLEIRDHGSSAVVAEISQAIENNDVFRVNELLRQHSHQLCSQDMNSLLENCVGDGMVPPQNPAARDAIANAIWCHLDPESIVNADVLGRCDEFVRKILNQYNIYQSRYPDDMLVKLPNIYRVLMNSYTSSNYLDRLVGLDHKKLCRYILFHRTIRAAEADMKFYQHEINLIHQAISRQEDQRDFEKSKLMIMDDYMQSLSSQEGWFYFALMRHLVHRGLVDNSDLCYFVTHFHSKAFEVAVIYLGLSPAENNQVWYLIQQIYRHRNRLQTRERQQIKSMYKFSLSRLRVHQANLDAQIA